MNCAFFNTYKIACFDSPESVFSQTSTFVTTAAFQMGKKIHF
jgi:hypothetical protein